MERPPEPAFSVLVNTALSVLQGNSFHYSLSGARSSSSLFLEATPRQELPHALLTC
jgi:hypothetical protein